jgi:hypothetical protein
VTLEIQLATSTNFQEPMVEIHAPVLLRMPDHVELRVYCPMEALTAAALEERILPLVEEAVGEPIRHTMRRGFPAQIKGSLADEIAASWKSQSGVLLLSNRLSSPNHTMINARIAVRRDAAGGLHKFGSLGIFIHESAPKADALLQRLKDFVLATRAHFGRADSPAWTSVVPVVVPLSDTWHMRERFGALTFLPSSCSGQLRPLDDDGRLEALEGLGHVLVCESLQACADASTLFAE